MTFAHLRCTRFPARVGAWHIVANGKALCGVRPMEARGQYWEEGEALEGYCYNCRKIEEMRK